jgi:drug/metabolite transporter (DMT)-like permease
MTSAQGAARPDRREFWIGIGCAAAILSIWTGFILVSRFGARSSFSPPDLLALRVTIAGLVMVPLLWRDGFGGLNLLQALALAVLAGLGFAGFAFTAFSLAPAAHAAALMTGTLPFQTSVLAVLFLGERFGGIKLIGLGLILIGVFLIAQQSIVSGGRDHWRGDVLFFLAATSWAIYSILAQRWRVRPLQSARIVFPLAMILYLPVYLLAFEPKLHTAPLGELVVQAVMQGLLATIVSMFAYVRVVVAFGAASTTMLTAAVPAAAVLLAIPLLGEVPSWVEVAGIACVSGGIAASLLALHRRP